VRWFRKDDDPIRDQSRRRVRTSGNRGAHGSFQVERRLDGHGLLGDFSSNLDSIRLPETMLD